MLLVNIVEIDPLDVKANDNFEKEYF